MQELVGPVLEQLLGPQSAEHPLLDAAVLRQSPPQLVVVVVGTKARPATLLFGWPSDFSACNNCFGPLRFVIMFTQYTQVCRACSSLSKNIFAMCRS